MVGASFVVTQYLYGKWLVSLMAKLCVQEKISKINAELARLELEMELDHGECALQGRGLVDTITRAVFGDGTEKATGAPNTAFKLFLDAVFAKLKELFTGKEVALECKFLDNVDGVLDKFQNGTGKAKAGYLLCWECTVGVRAFFVFMRVFKKKTEYSLVRAEGLNQKDFSRLEYSDGSVSNPTTVDEFIERIVKTVVKGADIVHVISPK